MKEPLLHEDLFLLCRKVAGKSVWAIEMGATEKSDLVWWVYCDDKMFLKKLPRKYKGHPVKVVFCQKPPVPIPSTSIEKE